ncbi:hypothetical protein [Aquisalinus flavus]|uniref:Uncharacterized protein n=1 Tax=Aquisalinus flavus TaxID=1526572 RepID=A0A8J2V5Z1_9PROT|nr:hypothetical protein [Aquisalinus flavus]MBD0427114.1 hypothetical protein [Aquisalinus flavus]UNE46935.1 hypothetical protein FF099_02125 [Aquisalinus flavus]GGC98499.1 hypothetical protein GCM10011342_04280 [Aquisalinus flavus]
MLRTFIFTGLRLLGFVLAQAATLMVLGGVLMAGVAGDLPATGEPADPGTQLAGMLLMVAAQGIALMALMHHLSLGRLQAFLLAAAIAVTTGTVLTQIDSFVYFDWFRSELGWRIVAVTALTGIAGALWASLLFPRKGQGEAGLASIGTVLLPVLLIAILHIAVYYGVGYVVVWVNDEARAYYEGGELLPFFTHMADVAATSAWIFPVQLVRGLFWAAVAVLVYRHGRGPRLRLSLTIVALYFAYHAMPLAVPNGFMPEVVRVLHFIELAITAIVMAGLAHLLLRPGGQTRS